MKPIGRLLIANRTRLDMTEVRQYFQLRDEPGETPKDTDGGRLAEQPIAAAGGLGAPATRVADPYHALDELMAVVEALCPHWPERPTFPPGAVMRL